MSWGGPCIFRSCSRRHRLLAMRLSALGQNIARGFIFRGACSTAGLYADSAFAGRGSLQDCAGASWNSRLLVFPSGARFPRFLQGNHLFFCFSHILKRRSRKFWWAQPQILTVRSRKSFLAQPQIFCGAAANFSRCSRKFFWAQPQIFFGAAANFFLRRRKFFRVQPQILVLQPQMQPQMRPQIFFCSSGGPPEAPPQIPPQIFGSTFSKEKLPAVSAAASAGTSAGAPSETPKKICGCTFEICGCIHSRICGCCFGCLCCSCRDRSCCPGQPDLYSIFCPWRSPQQRSAGESADFQAPPPPCTASALLAHGRGASVFTWRPVL